VKFDENQDFHVRSLENTSDQVSNRKS